MITSSVAKITLVVAEITFKVIVITSSVDKISLLVAKINFVVAGTTLKVAVITVNKIRCVWPRSPL